MPGHWSARCLVLSSNLQNQTSQHTSSVTPGSVAFFKDCPVLLWGYLRPLLLLGTLLNLTEQMCQPEPSNARPRPLTCLLPCSKTALWCNHCLLYALCSCFHLLIFLMDCKSDKLVSWSLSDLFLYFVYQPVTSQCLFWLYKSIDVVLCWKACKKDSSLNWDFSHLSQSLSVLAALITQRVGTV